MAIHLRESQYRGVNAHLHSYFQRRGGWSGFHSQHIVDLLRAIQTLLPVESGYLADAEESLQIVQYDLTYEEIQRSSTKPDITIYQTGESFSLIEGQTGIAPTLSMSVAETITEPEYVSSIVIYRVEGAAIGEVVTRIELLSPANKPPGSHYPYYIQKRAETLLSGVNLVEIDYLHERRLPVVTLPSYPNGDDNAYPYTILVSNPLPNIDKGRTDVYGFRVDDPIPTIAIPLADTDRVRVDFGEVYQMTFKTNPRYGLFIVDYDQLPDGFDSYVTIDQQRIKDRMALVADQQRRSDN